MNFTKLISLTALLISGNSAVGQQPYVDFHTHLTFKHYYKDISNPSLLVKDSEHPELIQQKYGQLNWQPFTAKQADRLNGKESNFKNYYQTNFSELENVQGSILCNAFYPWEKIRTISWINRLIDHVGVSKLSMSRLKVTSLDSNSPFEEFMGEYLFAANQAETRNGYSIKFAHNNAELLENMKQNITSSVMTIEGAQVLSGLYVANKKRINSYVTDNISTTEMMNNVKTLKNLPHRLFFITPGHFSWNRVAGYAKTLDKFGFRRATISTLSHSRNFRSAIFYKPGEGLSGPVGCLDSTIHIYTETCKARNGDSLQIVIRNRCNTVLNTGAQVIAEFLNPATSIHHKATYIDVKHMDILARRQYYAMKDSLERIYNIKIPVIASHTAVSGESSGIARATGLYPNFDKYREIRDPRLFYEKERKNNCTWIYRLGYNPFKQINQDAVGWFYPWSVNLYDEEIGIIHKSDGIMGLMVDGRLLGENMKNYTSAYKNMIKANFLTLTKGKESYKHQDFSEFYEVIPFIRNMLYIATHCGDKICWDHVALGTDFDGLIHPLKNCPTVNEIPVFKEKLNDYLAIYLKITPQPDTVKSINVSKVLDKVFYENGKNFVIKYF